VLGWPHVTNVERQPGDAVEHALACAERDWHDLQPDPVDRAE
jgi:hypothetical protein